jgi:anti-anti-sigma factor
MSTAKRPILEVYQSGPTTVVGFGGRDVLEEVNVAACRDELVDLIDKENCEVLAFDLTGVRLVPSGMLGLLASVRQQGVEVHLYNPSDDIRDVLAVTGLDSLMPIHQVDVPSGAADRRSEIVALMLRMMNS